MATLLQKRNKQTAQSWLATENVLRLDRGRNQHVSIPHRKHFDFELTDDFSIWGIFQFSGDLLQVLASKVTGTVATQDLKGWEIVVSTSGFGMNLYFGDTSSSSNITPITLNEGRLYSYCLTFINGSLAYYINGNPIGSSSVANGAGKSIRTLGNLLLGCRGDLGSNGSLGGLLGGFKLFNKGITAVEAAALDEEIAVIPSALQKYCVGHWTLNQRYGSYVWDSVRQYYPTLERPGNMITNGEFNNNGEGWMVNNPSFVTFSGNTAIYFNPGTGLAIKQQIGMVEGRKYRIRFAVANSNFNAPVYMLVFVGQFGNYSQVISGGANGFYDVVMTCSSNIGELAFMGNAGLDQTFTISQVEVYPYVPEIAPAHGELEGFLDTEVGLGGGNEAWVSLYSKNVRPVRSFYFDNLPSVVTQIRANTFKPFLYRNYEQPFSFISRTRLGSLGHYGFILFAQNNTTGTGQGGYSISVRGYSKWSILVRNIGSTIISAGTIGAQASGEFEPTNDYVSIGVRRTAMVNDQSTYDFFINGELLSTHTFQRPAFTTADQGADASQGRVQIGTATYDYGGVCLGQGAIDFSIVTANPEDDAFFAKAHKGVLPDPAATLFYLDLRNRHEGIYAPIDESPSPVALEVETSKPDQYGYGGKGLPDISSGLPELTKALRIGNNDNGSTFLPTSKYIRFSTPFSLEIGQMAFFFYWGGPNGAQQCIYSYASSDNGYAFSRFFIQSDRSLRWEYSMFQNDTRFTFEVSEPMLAVGFNSIVMSRPAVEGLGLNNLEFFVNGRHRPKTVILAEDRPWTSDAQNVALIPPLVDAASMYMGVKVYRISSLTYEAPLNGYMIAALYADRNIFHRGTADALELHNNGLFRINSHRWARVFIFSNLETEGGMPFVHDGISGNSTTAELMNYTAGELTPGDPAYVIRTLQQLRLEENPSL